MVKRILITLDETPYSKTAVKYAIEIAQQFKAQITGIAVLDEPGISSSHVTMGIGTSYYARKAREKLVKEVEQRVEQVMTEFSQACSEAGVTSIDLEANGVPFDAIIDESKYYDLIVMGAKTHFCYKESIDEARFVYKVMQEGVRPLLVVPEEYKKIETVVIAFDGSVQASQMLQRFAVYRIWADTNITLLHVIDDDDDDERQHADLILSRAAAYLDAHGIHSRRKCLVGEPKEAIPEYADSINADLICVGAFSKNRISQFFFGSVTKNLIELHSQVLFLDC